MKTKGMSGVITATLLSLQCLGQNWNAGPVPPPGNVIGSTEYLGAAATSTVPLLLKTVPNLPIYFSTNNVNRMRLNGTLTGQTVNGYTGLTLSGFLGVGNFTGV